jgi:hypothetical protein
MKQNSDIPRRQVRFALRPKEGLMKLVRTAVPKMKKLAFLLACSPLLLLLAEPAHPQAVTQTPAALTFGIPFVPGTPPGPPLASAEQAVTVTITSGSVTFSSPSAAITGTNGAQFTVRTNSCKGTMTAPASCQVGVTFSSSSSSLQTASLQIAGSGFELSAVPLSGAYGAIKLFDATTVAASVNGASFDNLYTIGSKGLNLSCPAGPVAVLSSTPNGLDTLMSGEPAGIGNVLVDNYISLSINNTPVQLTVNGIPNSPAGNVCQGSDAAPDNFGGTFQQECFSAAYRSFIASLVGQNTDAITAAGNSLLNGAAGGIPYLNVGTFFPSGSKVEASVSIQDAGGYVASSTLFLVTDCSQTGIVPGGTITGNPITGGNPASQTQTFTFDSSPGQNISFTSSEQEAIQQGTVGAPNGTVPQVTNFGIPQELFNELVTNTSAGPAVCLRMTGEVDPATGKALCKAFKIVCVDPATGIASGDNCVSGTNTARNLYDSAQFTSPDAPTRVNFLQSACANFMLAQMPFGPPGTCAASSPPGPNPTTLIGPGFLLGSDNWLTQNSTPPLYSSTNCDFIGTLAGDLCPLDTLTQFRGAADPLPGGTTGGRNTVYVPVVNKPLPFTHASIQGQMNGWVNSGNVTANFTSYAATYNPTATNPPSNGFMPAAPYSLTYGISSFPAVPDTTYAVPGDTTNYNDPYVMHNFGAPLCQAATPASFTSSAVFSRPEGIYNLHYFTTDCALTEELLFNPTTAQLTDPTANWASFPVLTFGVDTTRPTITTPTVTVSNSKVTATYTCSDTGSVFVNSGIAQCGSFTQALSDTPLQGPPSVNIIDTTFPNALGPHTVTVTATDVAGNTASSTVSYSPLFGISPLYDQTVSVLSGSTIPIKMYLVSSSGRDVSSASIIVHAIKLFQMSTNTSKPVVAAGNANPGNNFRFDSTLGPRGGYIFNLNTTGLGKGKWVIQFVVGSDPTIYTLGFGIN